MTTTVITHTRTGQIYEYHHLDVTCLADVRHSKEEVMHTLEIITNAFINGKIHWWRTPPYVEMELDGLPIGLLNQVSKKLRGRARVSFQDRPGCVQEDTEQHF